MTLKNIWVALALIITGCDNATIELSSKPLPPPPGEVAESWDFSCASATDGGFSKTLFVNWDWSVFLHTLDTYKIADASGAMGLGTNGILVVAFTPTFPADIDNLAMMAATGYPAPNMGNQLTLAVSTKPCDLNPPAPASSQDMSPTVVYGVGKVPHYWATDLPSAVALIPGQKYYINLAGRSNVSPNAPSGVQTCVEGRIGYPYCEVRLEFQAPKGH